MAPTICYQLDKQPPKSIANRSKFPQEPGIYMFGDTSHQKFKPLYAGQTNNMNRRIYEHMHGDKQHIDQKLESMKESNIAVKYQPVKNPQTKEDKYIQCMEKILNRPLPYNKIGGIAATKKRSEQTKAKRGAKRSKK